jgi:modulator of FtsH protease
VLLLATIPVVIGLHIAAGKGGEQLAIGLLFGLGLLLGLAVAPLIADYANGDPSGLWQAAGATAAFVAATGAYGYAARRDLSSCGRTLFWALLGLIAFGIVAIFVSIPNENVNLRRRRRRDLRLHDLRLQPPAPQRSRRRGAIAAGRIFLDVFNVFLLTLDLFGGRRDQPGSVPRAADYCSSLGSGALEHGPGRRRESRLHASDARTVGTDVIRCPSMSPSAGVDTTEDRATPPNPLFRIYSASEGRRSLIRWQVNWREQALRRSCRRS